MCRYRELTTLTSGYGLPSVLFRVPTTLEFVMTTLMVASTGGHLNELVRLAPRLVPQDDDVVWVTNETVQSKSLLGDARTLFVPYIGSRNLTGTAANAARGLRILRRLRPGRVVSTGSGIALAFLPSARLQGIECHYIESGTRVTGPSATGRALERIPGCTATPSTSTGHLIAGCTSARSSTVSNSGSSTRRRRSAGSLSPSAAGGSLSAASSNASSLSFLRVQK